MAGKAVATTRNSDKAIEGRVVNRPQRNSATTGTGDRPRTEYVLVQKKDKPEGRTNRYGASYTRGQGQGTRGLLTGNPNVVGYAWLASMAMVAWDEWFVNGILPRPARLWHTSAVYMLLAGLGVVAQPVANALAIGYFLVLVWQYYNKTGQFS